MLLIFLWYNNISMTQKNSENNQNKREYSRIPIKKRMLLVKEVLKRGKTLTQTIQKLNIKVTTARFIINKYKESGTFPRRKFKRSSKKRSRTQKNEGRDMVLVSQQQNIQKDVVLRQQSHNQVQLQMEQPYNVPFYVYWYYYPFGQ